MSNLVVIGFKKEKYQAVEALGSLRQLNNDWTEPLDDAVAVHRDYNGELVVDQSYRLTTGDGVAWGTLWGSLIGLVLAIPFTGGATAPAAAVAGALAAGTLGGGALGATVVGFGAKWWKEDFGISEDFVRHVGEMIQPGDSAIFALLEKVPDEARNEFEGFGGKVMMTSLSNEQKAKIENVLNEARG